MKVEVLIPQLGESITEATIIKWLKGIGEKVKEGEPILEISTEKVDTEVNAPAAGVLMEVFAKDGDRVAVQKVVAVLDTSAEGKVASMPPHKEKKGHPLPIPGAEARDDSQEEFREEPPAAEDLEARFFSPLVKTLAVKYGVTETELKGLEGSGPGGKVTKDDLLHYIDAREERAAGENSKHKEAEASHRTAEPVPRAPARPPSRLESAPPVLDWDERGQKILPMDTMRQAIAEHMVRSKHTSPHVYSVQELDASRIVAWRERHRAEFEKKEGFKLSLTPFFLEATVQALLRYPYVNCSIEGKNIVLKKHVNLGCAVVLGSPEKGAGLIVPVIRNAEEKNLVGLARALNDLARRARDRQLLPEEVTGGTFTLTNAGVLGTLIGTPVINQPQVAILCLGEIKKRPVIIDNMIAIREMCYITLSYDHRVIDGALSGAFLKAVRNHIENWDSERALN